jgi:hypothetical protein
MGILIVAYTRISGLEMFFTRISMEQDGAEATSEL